MGKRRGVLGVCCVLLVGLAIPPAGAQPPAPPPAKAARAQVMEDIQLARVGIQAARSNYDQAYAACLEGRGYQVR